MNIITEKRCCFHIYWTECGVRAWKFIASDASLQPICIGDSGTRVTETVKTTRPQHTAPTLIWPETSITQYQCFTRYIDDNRLQNGVSIWAIEPLHISEHFRKTTFEILFKLMNSCFSEFRMLFQNIIQSQKIFFYVPHISSGVVCNRHWQTPATFTLQASPNPVQVWQLWPH